MYDDLIDKIRKLRNAQSMYDRTKHYIYAHELQALNKSIDLEIAERLANRKKEQMLKLDFPEFG